MKNAYNVIKRTIELNFDKTLLDKYFQNNWKRDIIEIIDLL